MLGAIRNGLEVEPFGTNRCYNSVSHDILVQHGGESKVLIAAGTSYPLPEPRRENLRIKHSLETSILLLIKEKYRYFDEKVGERKYQEYVINDINFYHPFFYTGEEIEVSIDFNIHGLLKFTACHTVTGEQIDFEANKQFTLKPEELAQAQKRLAMKIP